MGGGRGDLSTRRSQGRRGGIHAGTRDARRSIGGGGGGKGTINVEVVEGAAKSKEKLTPKGKVEDRPQLGNGKA